MLPPEEPTDQQPPFYLGLCMAGAISAGAYTAGVVDYLVEALDRWEQARKTDDPRVPTHRVLIDSMTGASAGGMTAAVAAAALHDHLNPVNTEWGGYLNFRGRNKLYEAWVNLVQDEMLPIMLRTDDLPEFGAASVLNSNFIDTIARDMLHVKEPCPPRRYVSPDLEICVSLSNLTGFQEVIQFDNDSENKDGQTSVDPQEVDDRYVSINHRDFGHFVVDKEYQHDGRIPVSFGNDANEGLRTLRDCAMATGAFPIGLRWRSVRRLGMYINDNPLINYRAPQRPIQGVKNDQIYASVNVDGGMLNNEPFEIARKIMADRMVKRLPKTEANALIEAMADRSVPNKAKFSILMIEPFPAVENAPRIQPKQRLLLKTIIGQIYATMRSQLQFKQEDLQQAANKDAVSQYIIAPTRKTNDNQKIIGSKAIACGSLGGFGGFLTEAYRIHDFQLGRINCQRFIREHFWVADDTGNDIFRSGYSHKAAQQVFGQRDENDKLYYPVIPDIDPTLLKQPGYNLYPPDEPKPAYPVLPVTDLRKLVSRNREALKDRLFAILDANGVFSNLFVGLGVRLFKSAIMGVVVKQVEEMVIEDLYDHKLVKPSL